MPAAALSAEMTGHMDEAPPLPRDAPPESGSFVVDAEIAEEQLDVDPAAAKDNLPDPSNDGNLATQTLQQQVPEGPVNNELLLQVAKQLADMKAVLNAASSGSSGPNAINPVDPLTMEDMDGSPAASDPEVQFNASPGPNSLPGTTAPLPQAAQSQPLTTADLGAIMAQSQAATNNLAQSLVMAMERQSQAQMEVAKTAAARSAAKSAEYSIEKDLKETLELLPTLGNDGKGGTVVRDLRSWIAEVRHACSHLFRHRELQPQRRLRSARQGRFGPRQRLLLAGSSECTTAYDLPRSPRGGRQPVYLA